MSPDGKPFGTICVLDNKENQYSEKFERLILKFSDIVQTDLEIIFMNQLLGYKNKRLLDYLSEIQTLRGMITICSVCKKIKYDKGNWHPVEHYLIKHPEADFSHSICSECMKKHYSDFIEDS